MKGDSPSIVPRGWGQYVGKYDDMFNDEAETLLSSICKDYLIPNEMIPEIGYDKSSVYTLGYKSAVDFL